jgi:hypothetical protein
LPPARGFEIRQLSGAAFEAVLRAVVQVKVDVAVLAVDDAERATRVLLVVTAVKLQRERTETTEADIGQPRLVEIDAKRHVVEDRAEPAGAEHPTGQDRHVEPELPQKRGEQAVELVAQAAPAAADDLVEQRLVVERDGYVEVDIEVLERDRAQMLFLQAGECVGVRSRRSIDLEPGEVGIGGGGVHGVTLRNRDRLPAPLHGYRTQVRRVVEENQMASEQLPRRAGQLLAVFADAATARNAEKSLIEAGVARGAISVGDSTDENPSLRAEMREELDKSWILPQAGFVAPKEGARSLFAVTLTACVIAAVIAVGVAFIDFGMNFWARLLVTELVFIAMALVIGLVAGPALGVKRPDEPMAAQRGVTLRVGVDDAPTRERLMAFKPIRVDVITVRDEPVATVMTEEDRAGGEGVAAETVKAVADITSNMGTDDFHPPTDRGIHTTADRPDTPRP